MKQLLNIACASLLVLLASCGGSPEDQAGAAMDDLTSALSKIEDVESAKKAVPAIEKAVEAMNAAGKEMEGKSEEDFDEATKKKMEAKVEAMTTEMMRVMMLPGVAEVLQPAMDKMDQ